MPESEKIRKLDETSPSIQTHLGIMHGVIHRMADNSTSSKAWCITMVSAILVIVADKGNPDYAWIAVFPTVLFAALDAYYLALEKGFRNSYNSFVKKLHSGTLLPEDLYSVVPVGNHTQLQIQALRSFAIWGFYIPLITLVAIARSLVIG